MNQFKSIWGLMLGILLLGVNQPGEAGLTPQWFTIPEAHEDKTVTLYEGPGPKAGLRPVDINRHGYVNLCCKKQIVEIGPDTFMNWPRDLIN